MHTHTLTCVHGEWEHSRFVGCCAFCPCSASAPTESSGSERIGFVWFYLSLWPLLFCLLLLLMIAQHKTVFRLIKPIHRNRSTFLDNMGGVQSSCLSFVSDPPALYLAIFRSMSSQLHVRIQRRSECLACAFLLSHWPFKLCSVHASQLASRHFAFGYFPFIPMFLFDSFHALRAIICILYTAIPYLVPWMCSS